MLFEKYENLKRSFDHALTEDIFQTYDTLVKETNFLLENEKTIPNFEALINKTLNLQNAMIHLEVSLLQSINETLSEKLLNNFSTLAPKTRKVYDTAEKSLPVWGQYFKENETELFNAYPQFFKETTSQSIVWFETKPCLGNFFKRDFKETSGLSSKKVQKREQKYIFCEILYQVYLNKEKYLSDNRASVDAILATALKGNFANIPEMLREYRESEWEFFLLVPTNVANYWQKNLKEKNVITYKTSSLTKSSFETIKVLSDPLRLDEKNGFFNKENKNQLFKEWVETLQILDN